MLPLLKYPKKILGAIKMSTKPTQVKANVFNRSISSTSLKPPASASSTAQKTPKVKKMAKVKKKADMIKRAMEMRLAKSA